MKTKNKISFNDFLEIESKLDIRIGQIVAVERVPKSKKLLKLSVIFGVEEEEEKTVVTNIGDRYDDPDDLLGLTLPFIVNLEPSSIMGITSEAMLIAGTSYDDPEKLQIGLFNIGIGTKLL